jgi:hypothetical protein
MGHSLPERLHDWLDWDSAAYWLAVCLGLMEDEPELFETRAKHVFWSNDPVGNMLYAILDQMVAVGLLETRDEPDKQFRWNAAFRVSWETAE